MGYYQLCPPNVTATQCQIWCRGREIGLDDRLLTRHGMALTLTVLRDSIEEIATSLLQRAASITYRATATANQISHLQDVIHQELAAIATEIPTPPSSASIQLEAKHILRTWEEYDNALIVPHFWLNNGYDSHPWLLTWWGIHNCLSRISRFIMMDHMMILVLVQLQLLFYFSPAVDGLLEEPLHVL